MFTELMGLSRKKHYITIRWQPLQGLTSACQFQFEGSSGTPTGSPLSSFLAEAVMQDLEHQVLLNNTEVILWDRYVDDVFSIVKTQQIRTVFDTITNITDGITFTIEKEKDGQIAFRDMLPTRTNGTIETQVYRKKTHTDQILNYNSNHPTQQKISCIKTLFNRVETHCNTTEAKTKELNHLYEIFTKNNYPKHFIDSVYKRKQLHQSRSKNTQQNRRIVLPYIHKISEITSQILDKLESSSSTHQQTQVRIHETQRPTLYQNHPQRYENQFITFDKHNAVYMIKKINRRVT